MSANGTKSGYLVKIELFIYADPHEPEMMELVSKKITEIKAGPPADTQTAMDFKVTEVRWLARRKVEEAAKP